MKVYSNEPSITLIVNGKSYGTQKPDDLHFFHRNKIILEPGNNRVEITAPDGLMDQATWTYTPATH